MRISDTVDEGDPVANAAGSWNDGVIEEFRANDGKVGGYFAGAPMILIHHVGAKSGTERVSPLVYLPDGRLLATLRSLKECKALASELARAWIRWGGKEPPGKPAEDAIKMLR